MHVLHVQVRVSEYNQVKGQVNQQSRKQTGSLAVRDLAGVVSSKDIISTENLVTLFVVVSKHTKLEWQSSYEKFCEFVVSCLSGLVFYAASTHLCCACASHPRLATSMCSCAQHGFAHVSSAVSSHAVLRLPSLSALAGFQAGSCFW